MKKSQPEYKYADELIDAVMEYIAQKWTPSMIRRQLREYFPDIILKTCNFLISKARARIRERYGISPEDYKGEQIAFYESVIRNKAKLADKLKAAERLDKLFGLENISNVDPAAIVEKILAFKRQAEQTIGGQDGKSTNGRQSETDKENKSNGESNKHNGTGGSSKNVTKSEEPAIDDGDANKADEVSGRTDGESRNKGRTNERQNTVDESSDTTESIDGNLSSIDEVNKELKFKTED